MGYPAYDQRVHELGSLSVGFDGFTEAASQRRLQFKGNQVVGGFRR